MGEGFDFDTFLTNLWQRENMDGFNKVEGKGGYRNGRYHPYRGTNGIDIGPGFLLKAQSPEFQRKARTEGLTYEELNDSVRNAIQGMYADYAHKVTSLGGNPDNITPDVLTGLIDMQWQVGRDEFLNNYPKFWKATANQDYKEMRKESLTRWKDSKGWHPDTARQRFRNNAYFHDPAKTNIKGIPALKAPIHTEQPDATRVARPATPVHKKDEGGSLDSPRQWGDLSLKEMSDIMAVAVKHGITSLKDIRNKWNEFAEGGAMPDTVGEYADAIYQNAVEEPYGDPSLHYDNVDKELMQRLTTDSRGHYDDAVKLPNHPSSPVRGTFNGKYFDLTDKGMANPNYTLFGLIDNGDADTTLRYKGDYVLPEVTVTPEGNYYDDTYNNIRIMPWDNRRLFKGGGYMPSKAVRDRIATWEGDSMKTNRSFEAEARDFNRVVPENIRQNLSQEQLDALYSYGYNVGMGNLKKRVLPTLQNYVNGRAGAEDVASSMWASRDKELRGLQRRRAYEKSRFVHGSPSDRRQGIATMAFNMDLPSLPSWGNVPLQQQVLPPNPTDYGIPIDYSPLVKEPVIQEEVVPERDNGIGLFSLMRNLGVFGEQQKQPLADYKPQQRSPFVVSAPTYNDTLLDNTWFANGGRQFDDGGVTINHQFTYDNPLEWMSNTYPTSRMIVDGVERQVFAGGDGSVWAIGGNNLPYKVMYQHDLPEVVVKPSAEGTLKRRQKDYLTISNDATAIDNGQPLNPHLNERGIQGAKAHAAWDNEHPNLAAWRDVATAVPFAVAAYPFAAGLGDMAYPYLSTVLANPYIDAGLTSLGGADAINDIANGRANAFTALEITPMMRLGKPFYNAAKEVPSLMDAADNWLLENAARKGSNYALGRIVSKGLNTTPSSNSVTEFSNRGFLDRALTFGNNSGKVIHADYGNGKGAFTSKGAYIENGNLYPGAATKKGQQAYSWWNADKPYSYGVNGQPFTRYLTMNEDDVPNLLTVREQNYPIGQWNGKSGFVKSSEKVTSSPVPLENAEGLEYDPITNVFGKVKYTGLTGSTPSLGTASFYGSDNNVTENILKWLGKSSDYKPQTPLSTIFDDKYADNRYLKLAELWRENGVDLSRVGIEDLPQIFQQRMDEIMATHPERYTLISPSYAPRAYTMNDYNGDRLVGNIEIGLDQNSNTMIDDIHNMTENVRRGVSPTAHGVQERGLNAAINVAKSEGGEGVITGREYLSAPKQYHVAQKFHDRKKISDTGIHTNTNMVDERRAALGLSDDYSDTPATSMLDLARANDKTRKTLLNAPVWLLKSATSHVPSKATIFNPSIIDRFGKMHIDWSDPNIFKGLIYPTIFGTGYSLYNHGENK